MELSVLDLSKTVMYEFWYHYLNLKCWKKAKLCCMDTDSFIVSIKTGDIYKGIAEDIETRFSTSNYEFQKLLPKGNDQKFIGLIKDELGGKMMSLLQ